MLELYHGSNQTIEQIDLALCKPYKDFGRVFYLTDILQQALDMAYRQTRVVGSGIPTVTKYLFVEKKSKFIHDYDVVIGPIADDGVAFQLQKFKDGGITLNELVKELTYKHLNHQYFFGTEKAISLLQRIL